MLTAANIATIQSALDTLATLSPRSLGCGIRPPAALASLGIKAHYCAAREYTDIGARKITRKVAPAHYYAVCEIDGLDVSATGATRAAALRNLFKALHNCALLNEPTLLVPLALREPTKAAKQAKQARAERKAQANAEALRRRAREWYADLDRAATAVDAERAAAPTIIGPAPEFRAVDSHDDSLQVQVGGYSRIVCNNLAPKFVEAPIVPAGAEAGTEGIFKALLGLRTEQKIVALVNALHAAGVTLHRVDEDGDPIVRAAMPDFHPDIATATVLNL